MVTNEPDINILLIYLEYLLFIRETENFCWVGISREEISKILLAYCFLTDSLYAEIPKHLISPL